jgi:hypothetical protein
MRKQSATILLVALMLASFTFTGIAKASFTTPSNPLIHTIADGYSATVDGSIVAFISDESLINQDLNGDDDTNDLILRYYDLSTNTLFNTGALIDYEPPQVKGNIIVFKTCEWMINQDLNNDGDTNDNLINYYNVATHTLTQTGITTEYSFSFDGSTIAFEQMEYKIGIDENHDGDKNDPVIMYYNLATGAVTNTHLIGDSPSICGSTIIFKTNEGADGWTDLNGDGILSEIIRIYNIQSGTVKNTMLQAGRVSQFTPISNSIIVLTYISSQDLNGDGYFNDDVVEYYNYVTDTLTNTGLNGSGGSTDGSTIAFTIWEQDTGSDLNGDGDAVDCWVMYYDLNTEQVSERWILGANPTVSGPIIVFETYEDRVGDLNNDGDTTDIFIRYVNLQEQPIGDVEPPQTSLTITSGSIGNNGWYVGQVTATLTATDNTDGSGVKELHYILDSGAETSVTGATATIQINTDGYHTLEAWASDNNGNIETQHAASIFKIDQTAPTIALSMPTTVILNQAVSVTWTATDSLSGIQGPPSGTIPIDTTSIGAKTATIIVKDQAGNTATTTKTVNIVYGFSGFLDPINNDGSSIFKLKSTVPVKFQLTDAQGNSVTTAVAQIYVAKLGNNIVGTDMEAVSTSAATDGNLFRVSGNQYIFNLSTKPLSVGTWQIKATLDDGTSKTVIISLK